jgi:dTMP kinase
MLRRLLLAPDSPPASPRAEALLMAADRAEHVALVIEPALAAGDWVVSDRYSASTIAYQGYGRGLDPAPLRDLVRWAAAGLEADLSVLIDVRVEVAAARLAAAGRQSGADRMERLGPEFAARVRQGFLAQAAADPARWLVVDGSAEVDALTAHIVASVRERLGERPDRAG